MKRFLKHLCIFATVQLILYGLLFTQYRHPDNEWFASSIDKHERLRNIEQPRIILIGGSSVAFGTDSKRLQQAFGREPVDMAIHASLLPPFMLHEALPEIRSGDVVVLSFAYRFMHGKPSGKILSGILRHNPSLIQHMTWREVRPVLDEGLSTFAYYVDRSVYDRGGGGDYVYARKRHNDYGDMIGHYGLKPKKSLAKRKPPWIVSDSDAIVEEIERFHQSCKARGAKVFYFHPAVVDVAYEVNRETIANIAKLINERTSIKVLNQPNEMAYPPELFYDTIFHLTEPGVERRTSLLIERLSNHI